MPGRILLVYAALLSCLPLAGQTTAQTSTPTSGTVPSGAASLTTGTQLVVVDVTVLDRDGQPVHGLKATDFMMEEGKKPQVIRNFDEHSGADAVPATTPKMPALPPGTFTDYQPAPASSTLNVLLLDALNTPMTDQSYVRYQLQQYVKHAQPGTRIAIFGLHTRLTILQGFTSDPEILKAAVEHKLIPRGSALLDDPAGTGFTPDSMADTASDAGAPASVVANLQQFEAETASFQSQLRSTYTIDAFKDLGRYLSQFPGRKNLIWFSGSFPLSIFADPDLNDPFAVQADASSDLREASNLLSRARVAVYPVDARGLQTVPVFSAANSGKGYARNPGKLASDISKFTQANAQEHFTMDQIADDTGGHAFYNTNDLASAVAKSITAGSNFYTLTYTPSERKTNGEYRSIKVQLQGPVVARGVKLSYRHGYYADNVKERLAGASAAIVPATTPSSAAAVTPISQAAYRDSSMQRGAPTLSEILFKVRVLPASTATEETLAPGNSPDPRTSAKGPYRRYIVDFAAVGGDFKLKLKPDGRREGMVQFETYVYDTDGRLLNTAGANVQMKLLPENYAALLKSGLSLRQAISVPAKGESFLRMGVRDVNTDRVGVVEVPISSVSRLPPLQAVAAPAAGAAAAPAAQGATASPKSKP